MFNTARRCRESLPSAAELVILWSTSEKHKLFSACLSSGCIFGGWDTFESGTTISGMNAQIYTAIPETPQMRHDSLSQLPAALAVENHGFGGTSHPFGDTLRYLKPLFC